MPKRLYPSHMCVNCKTKYRHDYGLCRSCFMSEAGDARRAFLAEQERRLKQEERESLDLLERRLPAPVGPLRTVVVNGREFFVMWDGSGIQEPSSQLDTEGR